MGLITSLSTENRQKLEAIATEKRTVLGFKAFEPLPARILAQHLKANIFTAETVPNAEPEHVKLLCDSDNWSAGIICQNPLRIVHNSCHAPTRQESNLMHEFAHVILKHKMVGYDPKTGLFQRRQQDEDEAVYLGGCLQIPKRGLLWAVQKKMPIAQAQIGSPGAVRHGCRIFKRIALHFNASEDMVKFRLNVSGIYLV